MNFAPHIHAYSIYMVYGVPINRERERKRVSLLSLTPKSGIRVLSLTLSGVFFSLDPVTHSLSLSLRKYLRQNYWTDSQDEDVRVI